MSNYLNSNIVTFPSSNSTNRGKITQESNLRELTTKLKLNDYVVSGMQITKNGNTVTIASGSVSVGGYLITTSTSISFANVLADSSKYYVYLKLNFESGTGNLNTNSDIDNLNYNSGVDFIVSKDLPSESDTFLVIGEVSQNSNPINYPTYPINFNNISSTNVNESLSDALDNKFVSSIVDDEKLGKLTFISNEDTDTVSIDNVEIVVGNSNTNIEIDGSSIVGKNNSNTNMNLNVTNDGFELVNGSRGIAVTNEYTNLFNQDSSISVSSNRVVLTKGTNSATLDDNTLMTNILTVNRITGASTVIVNPFKLMITSPLEIYGKTTINNELSVQSNITSDGDIRGARVFNAVYNDGVEFMEKSDKNEIIVSGDVVCFDDNGKVTKIKNSEDAKRIVGVVSSEETYGYALGGDGLEDDEKVPIGLFGRVFVNVPFAVSVGDLLAIKQDGSGLTKTDNIDRYVIGKVTKNSTDGRAYIKIMN